MNYAIILAAGVGQRMRNGGLPKQFLKLMGKPIIIYTLEKFEQCEDINQVVVVCHGGYIDEMQRLDGVAELGGQADDIVTIHDGVRPLVSETTIRENIRVAKQYGCAITVRPVTESVVITKTEDIGMSEFKERADTYSMTAPQTFRLGAIQEAYHNLPTMEENGMPLLDAAMIYAQTGQKVHLVKDQGANIKITTPEDFYFLKAILELEENKYIFGL